MTKLRKKIKFICFHPDHPRQNDIILVHADGTYIRVLDGNEILSQSTVKMAAAGIAQYWVDCGWPTVVELP